MSNAFPTWSGFGGPADDAWNIVLLGDVIVPGICSVKGLDCGLKHDKRKKRGQDGATSRDLGIEPSKFSIEVILTEDDWADWLDIFPKINPRTVGRLRQPVDITHPDVNLFGITQVRIVKISTEPPTARGGKVYKIQVEEWFDEATDQKQGPAKATAHYFPQVGFQKLDPKTGNVTTSPISGPYVADTDNMALRTFDDLPPDPASNSHNSSAL